MNPCFFSKSGIVKSVCLFLAGCLSAYAGQQSIPPTNPETVAKDKPPMRVIVSPQHPRTFDVGANDKLSQTLDWDRETRTLTAKVTYSEVSGGGDDEWDPANYETFTLPFPTVAVDGENNLFVVGDSQRKLVLGHLKEGLVRTDVVLRGNTHLVAHRHNGRLSAWLLIGPP
jgi:hypothetical protein